MTYVLKFGSKYETQLSAFMPVHGAFQICNIKKNYNILISDVRVCNIRVKKSFQKLLRDGTWQEAIKNQKQRSAVSTQRIP